MNKTRFVRKKPTKTDATGRLVEKIDLCSGTKVKLSMEKDKNLFSIYWFCKMPADKYLAVLHDNFKLKDFGRVYSSYNGKKIDCLVKKMYNHFKDKSKIGFLRMEYKDRILTWHREDKLNLLGIISETRDIEMFKKLYTNTVHSLLPADAFDKIDKLLEKYTIFSED